MKLRRCPIFLFVFLLCPAPAAAAKTVGPPCEAKEPSEWQTRIDREPAEREPAERTGVEMERVTPALTPLAVPTPLARFSGDALFKQAYEDVYRILSEENACSRFYGGAAPAVYVFNQLAAQFKSARIGGGRTAGQMSGETTNISHAPSGLSFRLFKKAVLNTNGPFYRREAGLAEQSIPRVGSFAPDTRGVRALILLHELGHVVKSKDGGWLLADDGKNEEASERNTELVEKHCGRQLRALGATTPRPAELATKQARTEPPARDASEQ